MRWSPDITVAAVVEQDDRFLLVEERIGSRLVLNQPAGHLEEGESLIDAVVRETLEETTRRFKPTAVVGVYLWKQPESRRTFLRVAFCGTVSDEEAGRHLDHGIERTLWLPREQIVARSARLRSPLVLQCIDDYMGGARHPLTMLKFLTPVAGSSIAIGG